MTIANQLKALLKSYSEGDEERFCSVAMQLAAHEAKIGHGKLAKELRDLVDQDIETNLEEGQSQFPRQNGGGECFSRTRRPYEQ